MKSIDHAFARSYIGATDPDAVPSLRQYPCAYLRENMFVTASGNYFAGAFECTRTALAMSDEERGFLYHVNSADMGFG
jgi:hypothetical protein